MTNKRFGKHRALVAMVTETTTRGADEVASCVPNTITGCRRGPNNGFTLGTCYWDCEHVKNNMDCRCTSGNVEVKADWRSYKQSTSYGRSLEPPREERETSRSFRRRSGVGHMYGQCVEASLQLPVEHTPADTCLWSRY